MGETAKKTLLAAIAAWLVTRALRRLVGVAMLAAILASGLTIANLHGVDGDGVRRVMRCETHAIARAAGQLRDSASNSSPSSQRRTLRALRGLGQCDLAPTSTASHRDRGVRR